MREHIRILYVYLNYRIGSLIRCPLNLLRFVTESILVRKKVAFPLPNNHIVIAHVSSVNENAAANTPSHVDETGNTAVRNKYF